MENKNSAPASVFLDTSVWLDLAVNEAGEPLLGALEALCKQGAIDLVVPQIIRDEFSKNKARVVQDSGRSLSVALDRATGALWKYGNPRRRRKAAEALTDIKHRLDGSLDVTAEAVKRIEKLFTASKWVGSPSDAIEAASRRALEKKAPFHTGKNSFADAVIIELYAQLGKAAIGRSVFVTHNKKDFSLPNGDQRLPHPDIAECFSRIKSRYFIKLVDALRALRPQEFAEAMYEHEFTMEPRRASEISDAIGELADRVWYDRHMVLRHKVASGKCKVIPRDDFGPKLYRASALGKVIVDDILAGAIRSAERVEKKVRQRKSRPILEVRLGDDQRQAVRSALGFRRRVGRALHVARTSAAQFRIVSSRQFPVTSSPSHEAANDHKSMLAATGMAASVLSASALISCFVCGSIWPSMGSVDAPTPGRAGWLRAEKELDDAGDTSACGRRERYVAVLPVGQNLREFSSPHRPRRPTSRSI
jgi:hypothetical protein